MVPSHTGVLKALAVAGRSTDIEIQRETAACLCNLALSDENKLLIAQSDVLTPLVSVAQSLPLVLATVY